MAEIVLVWAIKAHFGFKDNIFVNFKELYKKKPKLYEKIEQSHELMD